MESKAHQCLPGLINGDCHGVGAGQAHEQNEEHCRAHRRHRLMAAKAMQHVDPG